MSNYIIETACKDEAPREWDVFESSNPRDVISKTIDALSVLSRRAFEDGAESVVAAVKDETGKFVYTARLSFKATWLS